MVHGTLDTRFAQRTLRVAEADIEVVGEPGLPAAIQVATGEASEPFEGRRLAVAGTVAGGSDVLSDGLAVSIDDGTGPIRIVVTPAALGERALPNGTLVAATGPLGQRDSTGTGTTGYRIYVTDALDLVILPPPPTPSPSPTRQQRRRRHPRRRRPLFRRPRLARRRRQHPRHHRRPVRHPAPAS